MGTLVWIYIMLAYASLFSSVRGARGWGKRRQRTSYNCNKRRCSHKNIPVCGSNRKTYLNSCLLKVDACKDKSIKEVHVHRCRDSSCIWQIANGVAISNIRIGKMSLQRCANECNKKRIIHGKKINGATRRVSNGMCYCNIEMKKFNTKTQAYRSCYLDIRYSCEERGIDYDGHDIKRYQNIDSWRSCSDHCRDFSGCNVWSWKKKVCYLKSNDNGRRAQTTTISGARKCGGIDAKAVSSSVYKGDYTNYGPQLAWTGVSTKKVGFFHSKSEDKPWLVVELKQPVEIFNVLIINRKDCCGNRLKGLEIRAGLLPGLANEVVANFAGPGYTSGESFIVFRKTVMAKYISFQLTKFGTLQINGIKINQKSGYVSVGCFLDKKDRAISGGRERLLSNPIKSCYLKAKAAGNEYFAIQRGNTCFTSSDAGETYNKYGGTTRCKNGRGGRRRNDVYRIIAGRPTTSPNTEPPRQTPDRTTTSPNTEPPRQTLSRTTTSPNTETEPPRETLSRTTSSPDTQYTETEPPRETRPSVTTPHIIVDFTRRPPVSCSALLGKKKVGCFKEQTGMKLIHTARDIASAVSGGYFLDWSNFPDEVMRLVCDCETKASAEGYQFFSLRFWAECWAGDQTSNITMEDDHVKIDYGALGRESSIKSITHDNCVNDRRIPCADADSFCIGTVHSEYMYRVTWPNTTATSATVPQTGVWRTGVIKTTNPAPVTDLVFPSFPLEENGQ